MSIVALGKVIDVATLDRDLGERAELRINEVGEVTLQTRAPLVLDNYERVPAMGRFVLADGDNLLVVVMPVSRP